MLPYFPEIYDDELLYSVLARAMHHLGAPPYCSFSQYAFGRPDVRAIYDLPSHLAPLTSGLPHGPDLLERLIHRHTLFPYDVAFVDPEVRGRVASAMRDRGKRPAHALGKPGLRNGSIDALRFCADCLSEWEASGVEPYWRRVHQLPSALVCVHHGSVLRTSEAIASMHGRTMWVRVDSSSCPSDAPPVVDVDDDAILSRLRRLARDSWDLLRGAASVENFDRKGYSSRLRDAGFVRGRVARLDLRSVRTAVRDYWGGCLDFWPGLKDLDAGRDTWVDKLVRSPGHKPPLNHLLFRGWLDSLPPTEQAGPPFGEGPWLCANPLAAHYGEPVVTQFDLCRRFHGGKVAGRFTCACGFVYIRRRIADGIVSEPRFEEYGPLAPQMIRKCNAEGWSINAMARRLKVSRNAVSNIAAKNGIDLSHRRRKREGE